MCDIITDPVLGHQQVGNKRFSWKLRHSNTVLIFVDGSSGPGNCFTMERSSTGAVKMKYMGNWKFTLEQIEWMTSKCVTLLRSV